MISGGFVFRHHPTRPDHAILLPLDYSFRMKLTRYGADVIVVMALITLGLVLAVLFVDIPWLRGLLIGLALFLGCFTLYFFRDPERAIPLADDDRSVVISPADGKIVVIHEVEENEYHHARVRQISIFLSPLDVHVNRIPVSGRVDYFAYHKGKYLVAWHDKASELNERTHVGVDTGRYRLLFKQIAGAVARRIVCPLKVGDQVRAGERFGMIKFGSRMDVLVPLEMTVEVHLGDTVVAGETILCRLPEVV